MAVKRPGRVGLAPSSSEARRMATVGVVSTSGSASEAAARQTLAGNTDGIVYQDGAGEWHEELADGHDRPSTEVIDEP